MPRLLQATCDGNGAGAGASDRISSNRARPRVVRMDAALGPALKEGVRVVLHGLVKRNEQNGLAGVLGRFQPNTGRWAVTLDGRTEPVALKPQNLQLQSIEALLARQT